MLWFNNLPDNCLVKQSKIHSILKTLKHLNKLYLANKAIKGGTEFVPIDIAGAVIKKNRGGLLQNSVFRVLYFQLCIQRFVF